MAKSIADVNLSKLTPKMKVKILSETEKRKKEQTIILEKALDLKCECKKDLLYFKIVNSTFGPCAGNFFCVLLLI